MFVFFLLSFTGHDCEEVVSVTPYFCKEDLSEPCEDRASLEYCRDVAQEAAEYLSANADQLGPLSYKKVLERFPKLARALDEELRGEAFDHGEKKAQLRRSSGDEADLKRLDESIAQALANIDYPPQWKNTDSQPEEGNEIGRECINHVLGSEG